MIIYIIYIYIYLYLYINKYIYLFIYILINIYIILYIYLYIYNYISIYIFFTVLQPGRAWIYYLCSRIWLIWLFVFPLAPAAVFISLNGIVGCIDPIIHDWLNYSPMMKVATTSPNETSIMLDAEIANATLPLIRPATQGIYHGNFEIKKNEIVHHLFKCHILSFVKLFSHLI